MTRLKLDALIALLVIGGALAGVLALILMPIADAKLAALAALVTQLIGAAVSIVRNRFPSTDKGEEDPAPAFSPEPCRCRGDQPEGQP